MEKGVRTKAGHRTERGKKGEELSKKGSTKRGRTERGKRDRKRESRMDERGK